MTTRTALSRNGTRQPQLRNWSCGIAAKGMSTSVAMTAPEGAPEPTIEAAKPRDFLPACSIDKSVAPAHSPPTAKP